MLADTLTVIQGFCGTKLERRPVLGFRARGDIFECNVLAALYGALQVRSCDIGNLVVLIPKLTSSGHEQSECIVYFDLWPTESGGEMAVCPGLVRDVLGRSGWEILNQGHGRDRSVEGLI